MWKKTMVVAAAFVVAGSMIVYAQQRGGQEGTGGPGPRTGAGMMGGWRPSPDDMSAFADARIAALHAGLRLNADQEKSWPAFEQALRDLSKMRIERLSAARNQQPQPSTNPIERLQRRADAMTTRGTALKHLADTAAPLYQSLDDAQKHRFTMLARFMRQRQHHAGMQRGDMQRGDNWRERFGGWGRRLGDGERTGFGLRRFGEADPMRERTPGGMGRMRDDEDDYRGPL
jgi:hypothetical protein